MKGMWKKGGAVVAVACLALGAVGCDNKQSGANGDENTLTYWCEMGPNTSQVAANMAETPFAQELMERLGIKIEYEHPPAGSANEKFSVMIAMGKLPDIIEYDWSRYSDGLDRAIQTGLIREIDLEKDAPNLYACVQENPSWDNWLKTDSGKYYGWPFIRGDRFLQTSAGLIVRKDWLDELDLEAPETMDDWTNMLRAFKEKKQAESPLAITTGAIKMGVFVGAYDTFDDVYIRDGKVVYGPIEDSYKEFLTQMNAWYEEGLIDADFASLDATIIQSKMLNGNSGAAFGSCGSALGKWLAAAPSNTFDLCGVKFPTLKRGSKNEFGQYQNVVMPTAAVISAKSTKADLAKKVLDYGYGEEGRMLFNFGIEGESYNMVDDYPQYTDLITNNPDGLSMAAALSKYALSQNSGPFLQDKRYMEQYSALPQQKVALDVWSDTNMEEHAVPMISLTTEQKAELSTLLESLDTAKSEWQIKFIMGIEPLSNFEAFREDLKNRGIDKYIQYMQEAYDRFLSR